MGKSLIVYSDVLAFKEWPTNFKLLFQGLGIVLAINVYFKGFFLGDIGIT